MADQPDFLNYGAEFENSSSESWSSHTEWQHTSYLGRLTLFILRLGDNSFTNAIIDALSDQDGGDSPQARMLTLVANLGGLIIGICVAYSFGRIVQIFIGKEIIMNQEIVIEEEITLSEYKRMVEEKKAKEAKRRSAKEKKAKNS